MQDKNNNKKILMAMVGAYLVYTGGSLISDVLKGEPQNSVLFIIAGAAFVLFGGLTVFFNMKSYIEAVKADVVYTDDSEDIEGTEEEEESEPEVRRHGHVEVVNLDMNHEEDVADQVEEEIEESEEVEAEDEELIILDLSDAEK